MHLAVGADPSGSEARVCGRSLAGIAGSNTSGGLSLVTVVCCHVEVFGTVRSLAQRSSTDCGVLVCVI
jgi:hypothetical protein